MTGTVVIGLDIGVRGNVLHPVVISGPASLQRAALDAIREYKYRPYTLNGKPVQVETTVSVPFTLNDACP
ncbi:energy transducer TonB [Telmatobacter sp. DSM 110680]|uniref:Energy transducer TonB n=1 Tax=Telmatobacter sp. DSM 110680 TaxID=3036704 RepID=A0AAU7DEZ3_9BACT